ncbi:MAG: hypothetical protein K0R90_980 [Oscillospiraceae bacterium]|jgi:putative membrane protein|nr:hypothetical protein [Oscillospiraceae bacterium]
MAKNLKKKKIMPVVVIIGVIIIPLLYSFFYLGAFWDPYSTLDTLPVAIVNQDKGAVINEKDRNLGQEMCDELKKDGTLKFVMTDEQDAKKGTEGKKYYAMLVVPSDFSSNIATSSQKEKQSATVTYSPNQKRNFLASQILSKATLEIEKNLRSTINKEITQQLSDKLKQTPEQLQTLQDGLKKLYDGSSDMKDGTDKLKDGTGKLKQGAFDLQNGTKKFSDKLDEYQGGVDSAKKGSNSLSTGAQGLNSGLDKLLKGATTLETSTKDLDQLKQGAKELAAGAQAFNTNLIAYTSGVDTLIATVQETTSFLSQYVAANPSLMSDPVFAGFIAKMSNPDSQKNIKVLSGANAALKKASGEILLGLTKLSDSANNLTALQVAVTQIKQGLSQAKAGSTKLEDGTKDLKNGMSELSNATQKLNSGAKDIQKGSVKLANGANDAEDGTADLDKGAEKLKNGVSEAKDGVDSSIKEANQKLKTLDGLDEFAADPVNIQESDINPVPNYGTAFAPYFLSLSLWVGALIIFFGIFLDADNKFKVLSRDSDKKVVRSFVYLLIGLVQAILLAIILKIFLGLQVHNLPLYFMSCCLVSVVFISIVQFLLVFFRDIGKFLAMVLLILQLTSCGGTFPMETVPKFFNVLYPFMPMTYSVNLFKESISGADTAQVWFNSGILVAILVGFMALTIILSKHKKAKKLSVQE